MHINCSDHGSTGKIINEIAAGCSNKGWKTVLCVPRVVTKSKIKIYKTSLRYEQGIYKRLCYLGILRYGFAPLSTAKILGIIKKEKPDIIHLHSINCNMVNIYRLIDFLKKRKISTVVTNHAEFFYTGSCAHANTCMQWINGCKKCDDFKNATLSKFIDNSSLAWGKMKNAFSGFDNVQIVSVSEWVNSRSKESKILGDLPNTTIKNGVNVSVFHPRKTDSIIKKYGLSHESKYLLHVTAQFSNDIDNAKGGYYIIKLAEMLRKEDVNIIVAGAVSGNCSNLPDNIKCIGEVLDQNELAELYSLAKVTLISSFRETYSMPVAESLCCGTPVVGFFAGGPETIALGEYTKFVEYGDIKAYAEAVSDAILMKERCQASIIAQKAQQEYSSNRMVNEYMKIYERMNYEKKQ